LSYCAVASPEFCVRGHRFGFVKRPKMINVYRTTRAALYTVFLKNDLYLIAHNFGKC